MRHTNSGSSVPKDANRFNGLFDKYADYDKNDKQLIQLLIELIAHQEEEIQLQNKIINEMQDIIESQEQIIDLDKQIDSK